MMIIIIRSSRIIATRQPTRMEVLESSAFSPIQVLVTEDVVPAITEKEKLGLKHQRFSVLANFLQSGTEKILGSSLSINISCVHILLLPEILILEAQRAKNCAENFCNQTWL